jgi:hypothetical protein
MSDRNLAFSHTNRKDRRIARAVKHGMRVSGVPLISPVVKQALRAIHAPTKSTPLPKGFDDQTLAITR